MCLLRSMFVPLRIVQTSWGSWRDSFGRVCGWNIPYLTHLMLFRCYVVVDFAAFEETQELDIVSMTPAISPCFGCCFARHLYLCHVWVNNHPEHERWLSVASRTLSLGVVSRTPMFARAGVILSILFIANGFRIDVHFFVHDLLKFSAMLMTCFLFVAVMTQ